MPRTESLTDTLARTFLLCVIFFEVGSAICAAAPSSTIFIVGRAVAGTASAGIFSGCMLIMVPMIPLHKRPMFQGLFGMVFGVASVIGPLIGGGFTTGLSWRSVLLADEICVSYLLTGTGGVSISIFPLADSRCSS